MSSKHHHGVHAAQCSQHTGAVAFLVDGTVGALPQSPDAGVGIDTHDEFLAMRSRYFKYFDMPHVKHVKHPIGEHHFQALGLPRLHLLRHGIQGVCPFLSHVACGEGTT